MELQQHRSCVLPADAPALEETPVETSIAQPRGILQERSANWPQEYNTHNQTVIKQSRSPSPTENVYARRPAPTGSYFTGNVHAQHIGLAGFGTERPEKQVEFELKRLYRMLQRSDKYQKYREKQPSLTVAEVLARDAADRKRQKEAAEGRGGKDEKDKTVWPEFLEHAFWRALVRWPPMGRKKYMLDGALRGRNELIQDSIRRDTGVERCRKQVSSHLQVLKQHLHDQPGVLVYMGTKDNDKKRHRGNDSSHAYHSQPHMRSRHHSHHAPPSAKYDYNAPAAQLWAGSGPVPSPFASAVGPNDDASTSPFSVTDFTMFVEDNNQPVHYFTQLSSTGQVSDLHVTDSASWRRQYPEFDFLRSQTDAWMKQNRKVLICDASIKVMTEARPKADLSITFELHALRDLSVFNSVQCITRFYDSGSMAPDPQFDGQDAGDLKEHQTLCHYMPDPHGPSGCLRIAFGSKFWVNRMLKYQSLRHRDEGCVSRSLLRLTATQDVYGIKPGATGEAECILTILWRFKQTTRSSAEVGSMNWRAVTFGHPLAATANQRWEQGDNLAANMVDITNGREEVIGCSTSVPEGHSIYQRTTQLPADFQHVHSTQNIFTSQVPQHHHQRQHHHHAPPPPPPPPLNLDMLASMQSDLDTPLTSTATSASTDYSQHSLSALSHSQDTVATYAHDANDFNFDGGHITISGAFGPAINLAAYDSFASQDAGLDGLQALSGLDQDGYNLGLACANSTELVDVGMRHDLQDGNMACYSTKPNWHHTNLVHSLENAAEQYHSYDRTQTTHGHEGVQMQHHSNFGGPSPALTQEEELVAHGLHDAHVNANPNLWNLQSPFQEDTGSGAHDTGVNGMKAIMDCRKDSVGQDLGGGHGLGLGLGVLDMIQREQRSWEH